jgi:hypothetical protein
MNAGYWVDHEATSGHHFWIGPQSDPTAMLLIRIVWSYAKHLVFMKALWFPLFTIYKTDYIFISNNMQRELHLNDFSTPVYYVPNVPALLTKVGISSFAVHLKLREILSGAKDCADEKHDQMLSPPAPGRFAWWSTVIAVKGSIKRISKA